MCGDRSWRGLEHSDLLLSDLPFQYRFIACCLSGRQGTCRKLQLSYIPTHMPPHLRRFTLLQVLWLLRVLWLSVWLDAVVCGILSCCSQVLSSCCSAPSLLYARCCGGGGAVISLGVIMTRDMMISVPSISGCVQGMARFILIRSRTSTPMSVSCKSFLLKRLIN